MKKTVVIKVMKKGIKAMEGTDEDIYEIVRKHKSNRRGNFIVVRRTEDALVISRHGGSLFSKDMDVFSVRDMEMDALIEAINRVIGER